MSAAPDISSACKLAMLEALLVSRQAEQTHSDVMFGLIEGAGYKQLDLWSTAAGFVATYAAPDGQQYEVEIRPKGRPVLRDDLGFDGEPA